MDIGRCDAAVEKAVGGFTTDEYCTRHSQCNKHAQGSCGRNNRCHYGIGNWNAETKVGASCHDNCIGDMKGYFAMSDAAAEEACDGVCPEEAVGGYGGECKQKDLDAGCKTVMKPFGPMKVPTCQCPGSEAKVGSAASCRKLDGNGCRAAAECSWSDWDRYCFPRAETAVGCAACARYSGKKRWTCEANACPRTQEESVGAMGEEKILECYDNGGHWVRYVEYCSYTDETNVGASCHDNCIGDMKGYFAMSDAAAEEACDGVCPETQVGEGGSYYFGGEYLDNCRTNGDCNSGNCKKRPWMDIGRCDAAVEKAVGGFTTDEYCT